MFLNNHSYYSLRYGTMSPEQLIATAKELGIKKLALTDINNATAIPEFVKLCKQEGIRPIAGMELRQKNRPLYIVLAKNPSGFRYINTFLTKHNLESIPLPDRFPLNEDTFAIYPFSQNPPLSPGQNEFIGIEHKQLHKLISSPLARLKDKLVILHPVSIATPDDMPLHYHLCAINQNVVLSLLDTTHCAQPHHQLIAIPALKSLFAQYPEIIHNTEALMEQCDMDFDFKTIKNKRLFSAHPADDRMLLQKLAFEGMEYRYGKSNKEAQRRIVHELDVIDKLGFSSYFLITWDIIRYSMSCGFYHVGRGSGANSIVAYCLRITDVDPIELDLYFERFINPKRSTPPDFDLDFSWKERDQVLDYIFKRYGHQHTALLGTISTFRDRAIVRELGKVAGLPKAEIDKIADNPRYFNPNDPVICQLSSLAEKLNHFPNLRSIHAGGVLISEAPICAYSPLDMPPKGFPTVQWDMYTAEDLSFEKIDILSQRGIGHINDATLMIKQNQNIDIDIHRIQNFKSDPNLKALLRSGDTTGCFYIESPAMRGLLKKLRCDDFITLVAASSIIRPGVARSGMMREYILRFHNPQSFQYLHPVMEEQLKETFGVMVYQEDVIKICHHFAGLDLADADVLRRAMSGKYRSKKEMQKLIDKFFSNCKQKGYPDEVTREVWRQIESFAGYSFSKAHSASFAVESYQSLFLKTYYPLEFMTAVINNFGGFYQAPVYFNEARRLGGHIELPCINHSNYTTTLIGKHIYIGLVHVSQLESGIVNRILEERQQNGPFLSLPDFVQRTGTPLQQIVLLIRLQAFRFTNIPKAQLLWQAHLLLGKPVEKNPLPQIFPLHQPDFNLPEPETDVLMDAYDEFELLGFTVSLSPFDMLKTSFRGEIGASELCYHIGKTVRMIGWLVATKYVRTIHHEIMHFGTFLDHKGLFFDTVHFPQSASAYPFRGSGVYLIQGTITQEFDFPSLTVHKMARLPLQPDPRGS